jgi:hypothetical protein
MGSCNAFIEKNPKQNLYCPANKLEGGMAGTDACSNLLLVNMLSSCVFHARAFSPLVDV